MALHAQRKKDRTGILETGNKACPGNLKGKDVLQGSIKNVWLVGGSVANVDETPKTVDSLTEPVGSKKPEQQLV